MPYAGICDVVQNGTSQRAVLCNLSLVGAYVHTERPPARNSVVELVFDLADGGPRIHAGATVTWVNDGPLEATPSMPRGFGARFLTADPDAVRRIANMVASFLADPEPHYQVGVGLPRSGQARIPFTAPCIFNADGEELSGTLCNLSTLGAFGTFERLPRLGARGRVRFGVPSLAGDFKVEAVVAWLNPEGERIKPALPPGCGLEFVGLSPIDQAILQTVVESYIGAITAELRPPHEPGEAAGGS